MKLLQLGHLYRVGLRFPRTVLILSLILGCLGLFFSQKLKIETDFSALLPPQTASVQNFNLLKKYFGSMGYLYLAVEADELSVAEDFSDQLVPKIEALPTVDYVEYRRPVDYFLDRKWLYVDLEDLEEMERRVDRSLALESEGVSPVFSHLMDFADEEDRPDLDFEDIQKKYKERLGESQARLKTGGKDEFIVIKVKAKRGSENYEANRRLVAQIQGLVQGLKTNFPSVQVDYTGTYISSIETVDRVASEMNWVSLTVLFTLLMILVLYFRQASGAVLVGLPLIVGILVTGGLVYFIFGRVNIITSFAVSILAGLGSDYGIYLLSRFFQARQGGKDFQKACEDAFEKTGKATFASMITTVGAFGALCFSGFDAFVEFGVIGGVGLILNYLGMVLIMPSLLSLAHKHRDRPWLQAWFGWKPWGAGKKFFEKFAKIFLPKAPRVVLLGVFLLTLASLWFFPKQAKIHMEPGQLDYEDLPSTQAYAKVRGEGGAVLDPTLLVVQGRGQEREVVQGLKKRLDNATDSLVFEKVVGISTFIPEQQAEKRILLERLQEKYGRLKYVGPSRKQKFVDNVQKTLAAPALTQEDLPEEVRRIFLSPQSDEVYAVYLYPSVGRSSSEEMEHYAQGIRQEQEGLEFTPVDGSFVSLDILHLISKEAAQGSLWVLLLLSLVLFLQIKRKSMALLILVHLFSGLVLIFAALYGAGIRLNVLNIAVFPIILGTGIDCFIHFYHRFQENYSLDQALSQEVPAILISNLTTMVGFGGLILTSNPGLRSIGWVCVIGLVIVSILCVLVFPRSLSLLGKRGRV